MAAIEVKQPLLQRVSWGAIFTGFFVGFGLWFLLLALGAGVGGVTFDARSISGWRGVGLGLAIWWIISGIVSFVGAGWITARFSAAYERQSGMLHGVAAWGFMLVVLTWAAATAVTSAVGGAAAATGGAVSAAGQAAQSGAGSQAMTAVTEQVTQRVNQSLQQQGLQPISEPQLRQAVGNIAQQALARMARGEPPQQAVDARTVAQGLAQAGVPPQQAQRVGAQVQTQLSQALPQAGQQIQQTAGQVGQAAATAGTAAAWGFFILAALTLVAAAIGGSLGVPGERRTPVVREEPAGRPLTPSPTRP
jgi:hypothetical protein